MQARRSLSLSVMARPPPRSRRAAWSPGVEGLDLQATSSNRTTSTAVGPRGSAVVLSSLSTGAVLGEGLALILPGDLILSADSDAQARALASLVALTIANHTTFARVARALIVGGAITIRADGTSVTLATATGSATTTTTRAVTTVRDLAATLGALLGSARGRAGDNSASVDGVLPAPSAVTLAALALNATSANVLADLPAGPVSGGGAIDVAAITAGSALANAGGQRDGGATVPSAAVTWAVLTSRVRVPGPLSAGGDVLLRAGRGPPAPASDLIQPAPSGPAALSLVTRSSQVWLEGPVTLTSPNATLTISDDTTVAAPIDSPPTTAFTPPAGAVLVSAALGGRLTPGAATLTFAPGALPARRLGGHHRPQRRGPRPADHLGGLRPACLRRGHRRGDHHLPDRPGAHHRCRRADLRLPDLVRRPRRLAAGDGHHPRRPTAPWQPPSRTSPTTSPARRWPAWSAPSWSACSSTSPTPRPGSRTEALDDVVLGDALRLTGMSLTITSVSASAPYSGSASFTATLELALTVGALAITATAAVTATYTLTNAATLDAGSLLITIGPVSPATTFGISITSGGTEIASLQVASATLSQSGADLTITATGVSATIGGQVQVPAARCCSSCGTTPATSTSAHRRHRHDRRRRLAGLTLTNGTLSYNGTDGLALAARPRAHRLRARASPAPSRITQAAGAITTRGHRPDGHAQRPDADQTLVLSDGSGTLVLGAAGEATGSLSATVVATGLRQRHPRRAGSRSTPPPGTAAVALAARDLSLDLGGGLRVSDAVVGLYVVREWRHRRSPSTPPARSSLTGYDDVALGGTFRVRINGFAAAISEMVAFADGSGDVAITFGGRRRSHSGHAFVALSGTGVTLAVLGQSMTADLAFAATATGFTVDRGEPGPRRSAHRAGHASPTAPARSPSHRRRRADATLTGDLAITVPGFTFSGALDLELSTARPRTTCGSRAPRVDVTLAGQVITFDEVTVARTTSGGVTRTDITLAGGQFAITQGGTDLLDLSAHHRLADHHADRRGGPAVGGHLLRGHRLHLRLAPWPSRVNTGSAAVGDLPAGPYLRVEALGTTITVGGQTLTADITFERGVDATGDTVVRAGLANASLAFVAGATTVLSVTNGTGALLVTAAGLAASFSGTLAVALAGRLPHRRPGGPAQHHRRRRRHHRERRRHRPAAGAAGRWRRLPAGRGHRRGAHGRGPAAHRLGHRHQGRRTSRRSPWPTRPWSSATAWSASRTSPRRSSWARPAPGARWRAPPPSRSRGSASPAA